MPLDAIGWDGHFVVGDIGIQLPPFLPPLLLLASYPFLPLSFSHFLPLIHRCSLSNSVHYHHCCNHHCAGRAGRFHGYLLLVSPLYLLGCVCCMFVCVCMCICVHMCICVIKVHVCMDVCVCHFEYIMTFKNLNFAAIEACIQLLFSCGSVY